MSTPKKGGRYILQDDGEHVPATCVHAPEAAQQSGNKRVAGGKHKTAAAVIGKTEEKKELSNG